jgi:hypothetical protein
VRPLTSKSQRRDLCGGREDPIVWLSSLISLSASIPTYYTYTYTPPLPQPLTLFTVLNTLRAETNPVRLAIFGFTEIETGASLPGEDVRLLLTGLATPRANDRSILQDTPFRTTYHLHIFIPCIHALSPYCIP